MGKYSDEQKPEESEWTLKFWDFGFPHAGGYVPLDAADEPEKRRPPEEPVAVPPDGGE